jgi:hypothetical protein
MRAHNATAPWFLTRETAEAGNQKQDIRLVRRGEFVTFCPYLRRFKEANLIKLDFTHACHFAGRVELSHTI